MRHAAPAVAVQSGARCRAAAGAERIQRKPQKSRPVLTGRHALTRMQHQAQACRKEFPHGSLPLAQQAFVIGKQHKVVHISQVCRTMQLLLDKVIELVQVDIGPELRRQIAIGRPQDVSTPADHRGEQDHRALIVLNTGPASRRQSISQSAR